MSSVYLPRVFELSATWLHCLPLQSVRPQVDCVWWDERAPHELHAVLRTFLHPLRVLEWLGILPAAAEQSTPTRLWVKEGGKEWGVVMAAETRGWGAMVGGRGERGAGGTQTPIVTVGAKSCWRLTTFPCSSHWVSALYVRVGSDCPRDVSTSRAASKVSSHVWFSCHHWCQILPPSHSMSFLLISPSLSLIVFTTQFSA